MQRFAYEIDAFLQHFVVIASKIVGAQKQEYTTTGLIADEGLLLR